RGQVLEALRGTLTVLPKLFNDLQNPIDSDYKILEGAGSMMGSYDSSTYFLHHWNVCVMAFITVRGKC
ncbi:hypothetical protein ACQP3L_37125, partial [Escherichia coli]